MHRQQWAQQLIRRQHIERRVLPACVGLLIGLLSGGLPLALSAEPKPADVPSSVHNAQSALKPSERFKGDPFWINSASRLDRDGAGLETAPNDHGITTRQPVPGERAMPSLVSPPADLLLLSLNLASRGLGE